MAPLFGGHNRNSDQKCGASVGMQLVLLDTCYTVRCLFAYFWFI
jgi:hypothetical protein